MRKRLGVGALFPAAHLYRGGVSVVQAGKSLSMLPARKKISKAKGSEPSSFEDSVASVRDAL